MNHSSILQIHLNGEENSLSGGEHSIRIFSLASASSSASPFPLLSEPTSDQKAKSRLKQQVRRLKGRRNLQVNWKATSDNTKKRRKEKQIWKVSRDLLFGVSSESQGEEHAWFIIQNITKQQTGLFWVTVFFAEKSWLRFALRCSWRANQNVTSRPVFFSFPFFFVNQNHHCWMSHVRFLRLSRHPVCHFRAWHYTFLRLCITPTGL